MREKNATNDDVGGGELSIPSNLTNFLTHEEAGNLDKVPERERHYTILYFLRGYGAYTHNDNCGPTYMRMAAGAFLPLLSFYHGEPKKVCVNCKTHNKNFICSRERKSHQRDMMILGERSPSQCSDIFDLTNFLIRSRRECIHFQSVV